jgi:hypothetical protein
VDARSAVAVNVDSEPRASAELVFLPIVGRKEVITKLARRLALYGDTQGRFFIRSELEKAAARRVAKGIPEAVATADVEILEGAIHVAAALMRRSGDAA